MNKRIDKTFTLKTSANSAFSKFVYRINEWWPRAYTWSQDKLVKISIDPYRDGLCTEEGPFGFRCDWGRVTDVIPNKKIVLKWQITFKRVPEPDPAKASDIEIVFEDSDNKTTVHFAHFNFENHGDDAAAYCDVMNSPQGWDYILECYKDFCVSHEKSFA